MSAGSMCEATYRNNARMLLEGDDCFSMEQLYSPGSGELVMSFLPEKDAEEQEGEEEEGEEEEVPPPRRSPSRLSALGICGGTTPRHGAHHAARYAGLGSLQTTNRLDLDRLPAQDPCRSSSLTLHTRGSSPAKALSRQVPIFVGRG